MTQEALQDQVAQFSLFESEMRNFEKMALRIKPSSGEIPRVEGIDIFGGTTPFNGLVGGDHIVYVDFSQRYDLDSRIERAKRLKKGEVARMLERNKRRSGILLADVSGHQVTDALMTAMLHQAFLTGVLYELEFHGEVTPNLFEILNNRFYNSSSIDKFITVLYGEISQGGRFRFLSAGHPMPKVFSYAFDKIVTVSFQRVMSRQPIGTLPSQSDPDLSRQFSRLGYKKEYTINELNLMGVGDILLLFSDGFSEHMSEDEVPFLENHLENLLRENKNRVARDIYQAVMAEFLSFAPPSDDVSLVVIKRKL
jgi:serine phosphatase RsbU (regulator of sigma subunit)